MAKKQTLVIPSKTSEYNNVNNLKLLYSLLKSFNDENKPREILDEIKSISNDINSIEDVLDNNVVGVAFNDFNSQIDYFKRQDDHLYNYLSDSLIPASKKVPKLKKLLEKWNQTNTASNHYYDYHPQFTSYLYSDGASIATTKVERNDSLVIKDRTTGVKVGTNYSGIEAEINSLINQIRKMSVMEGFEFSYSPNVMIPDVQTKYGVSPVCIPDMQTKYGVTPVNIPDVQTKYGVSPVCIPDMQTKYGVTPVNIPDVQTKYGVSPVCIPDMQTKYGVTPVNIPDVQTKYGVSPVCIPDMQTKYGVTPVNILDVQTKYGVSPVCIPDMQTKYGVTPVNIPNVQTKYGVSPVCIPDMQTKYGVTPVNIPDVQTKYGVTCK